MYVSGICQPSYKAFMAQLNGILCPIKYTTRIKYHTEISEQSKYATIHAVKQGKWSLSIELRLEAFVEILLKNIIRLQRL